MSADWAWQEGVTGDPETKARLSPERQIQDMIAVEAAFSRALGTVGGVSEEIAEAAARTIEAAKIDADRLVQDAARDGMPVPSLSRQLKEQVDDSLHPAVHAGLTSQDVMDTALVVAVRDLLAIFDGRLTGLLGELARLRDGHGQKSLMARTRMQAALPVTLGHRIGGWEAPLMDLHEQLEGLGERLGVVQLGGPVGAGDSFAAPLEALQSAFAKKLGLRAGPVWHTNRTRLAELGAWLSQLSGALAKMGHDIALMAQQGVDEIHLRQGGSSSAMAHKSNPVRAETLMALGRFNAVQLAGLHLALDHEQERSGAAWTLEWLILPPMLEATGAGLLRASELVADLEFAG